MSFQIAPDPGEKGEPDVKVGRLGGAAVGESRRLVRDGSQLLARGALICPECALPIAPPARIRPKAELSCSFCGHAGVVREFVRGDIVDTASNEVRVVARIV
jgi:hypothetical protein